MKNHFSVKKLLNAVCLILMCLSFSAASIPTINSEYGDGLIVKKKRVKEFPRPEVREDNLQSNSTESISDILGVPVIHKRFDANNAQIVQFETLQTVSELETMAATLMATGNYLYVDVNRYLRHSLTPNDARLGEMWGLIDPASGITAEDAWDENQGQGVIVAVVDTGFRPHVDLVANIIGGYDFVSNAAAARDGDGRDPNAEDEGDWFATNQCGPFNGEDSSWHGTHVAGTIAAVGNNNQGVVGVAYNSRVVPIRALARCGGTTGDIGDAIRWASGDNIPGVPANPNPARVINLSFSGDGECSATFQNAVNVARGNGSVVVAAASNENINVSNRQPANCDGVIAVASITSTGDRSWFSNFGDLIDIAAPGSNIISTLNSGLTTPGADNYVYYNGTSMAAPHVAGVAALLLSSDPSLTPDEIESAIKNSARPFLAGSNCNTNICGEGMLDAHSALMEISQDPADPPPGVPTNVRNQWSDGRGNNYITWNAVLGATYYEVYDDEGGVIALEGTTSSTNRWIFAWNEYRVYVKACNSNGCSALSSGAYVYSQS